MRAQCAACNPGPAILFLTPAALFSSLCYVIFFPDPALPCRNVLASGSCQRKECAYAHGETSLTKIISILRSARTSLDIAVFNITCNELAAEVMAARKRGVACRVLSDAEQMQSSGSDVAEMARAGCSVRVDLVPNPVHAGAGAGGARKASLMHHKFCVIDNSTVLTGSFNWTRQAVLSNHESVLICTAPTVVADYRLEFARLFKAGRDVR